MCDHGYYSIQAILSIMNASNHLPNKNIYALPTSCPLLPTSCALMSLITVTDVDNKKFTLLAHSISTPKRLCTRRDSEMTFGNSGSYSLTLPDTPPWYAQLTEYEQFVSCTTT